MEQEVQRKNSDRQEGTAEEILDAGNSKVEGHTKVAAAVQMQSNASVSSSVMGQQELLPRHHWIFVPRG